MKSSKRINLFSKLGAEQPRFALPKIHIGGHAWVSVAVILLFLILTISEQGRFRKQMTGFDGKKAEAVAEIDQLAREAGRVAEEERAMKMAIAQETLELRSTSEQQEPGRDPVSSGIDGSWTSVIWKLATFARDIIVQRIDLTNKEKSEDVFAEKSILIEGQAGSLGALTNWIELLTRNLPQSSFVMEQQSNSDDKHFPVAFKITGRI